MKVKITASTGRGIAHPKNDQPTTKQTYQDAGGVKVTVHSVQFNRVTFYREGYASPCTQSVERFIREYTEVAG